METVAERPAPYPRRRTGSRIQRDLVSVGSDWISPPQRAPLAGDETFVGLEATVADFWRFAMSDLRMNNTRGYLAEFLVARAVGSTSQRVEWDAYDVIAPFGAKIEVKSSAYLQLWDQRRPSTIRFSGLTGRTWNPQLGEAETATYNADVFVFYVHTAKTHAEYDPLNVDQWEFFVVARNEVEGLNYKSIGLSTLAAVAGQAIVFTDLRERVYEVFERQRSQASRE
jgi:hypothetical protein